MLLTNAPACSSGTWSYRRHQLFYVAQRSTFDLAATRLSPRQHSTLAREVSLCRHATPGPAVSLLPMFRCLMLGSDVPLVVLC